MNQVFLDAKAGLEGDGLIVRPSGAEALLVAATVAETGDGLGVSPDASMMIRQGDGWVAVFPAAGHRTYEVPGELAGLLALVRAVYERSRRGGGPLREASGGSARGGSAGPGWSARLRGVTIPLRAKQKRRTGCGTGACGSGPASLPRLTEGARARAGATLGMVASLTPRVRLLAVCDRARESLTEAGVYHLRGVRQHIVAPALPFVAARLWLFLVLSSPRPGTCPGYLRVVDAVSDKAIYFAHLAPHPRFEAGDETLAAAARLRCTFPREGRYLVQVWFYQQQGSDVLKAELPFTVENEGD